MHWPGTTRRDTRPAACGRFLFAQIGAIGLLRRAIRRVRMNASATPSRGGATRSRMPSRAAPALGSRCARAGAPFEVECVKQGVSALRLRRRCIASPCFDAVRRCRRGRRVDAVATRRRRPAGDFFSPGLLTGEKTVISFRPSRGDLRTRVSRATGTTRSTTKPSALEISKVDSGSFSLAKPKDTLRTDDLHRRAMRVFCCQESVPARLARRRLLAGPTPAAFQTGLQYP